MELKGIQDGASFTLSPAEEYLVRATIHRLRHDYPRLEFVTLERSQEGKCYTVYLRHTPRHSDPYDVVFRHDSYGAFLIKG